MTHLFGFGHGDLSKIEIREVRKILQYKPTIDKVAQRIFSLLREFDNNRQRPAVRAQIRITNSTIKRDISVLRHLLGRQLAEIDELINEESRREGKRLIFPSYDYEHYEYDSLFGHEHGDIAQIEAQELSDIRKSEQKIKGALQRIFQILEYYANGNDINMENANKQLQRDLGIIKNFIEGDMAAIKELAADEEKREVLDLQHLELRTLGLEECPGCGARGRFKKIKEPYYYQCQNCYNKIWREQCPHCNEETTFSDVIKARRPIRFCTKCQTHFEE